MRFSAQVLCGAFATSTPSRTPPEGDLCLRIFSSFPFVACVVLKRYGEARYVEPLAPRTELSYLEVRFRENKLERERAEREEAKRKAAAKPRSTRDDQVCDVLLSCVLCILDVLNTIL